MSQEKPAKKEDSDAIAKAFEQEYKDSHPNGPFPPVEVKPKAEKSPRKN